MKRKFNRKIPQKKEARKEKTRAKSIDSQKTFHHPQYGDIPLLQKMYQASDGNEYLYYDFDPEYKPPLPPGAIRANIVKQAYSGYSVPYFYYTDIERICIQCEKSFLFSAKEQKYWYEVLKFSMYSDAIRCLQCRRKKRSDIFIQKQLMNASSKLSENPEDPVCLLSYAEAITHHYERFLEGDINKGINSCRKALQEDPRLLEALFWEAKCQELAGRKVLAIKTYKRFINSASHIKRCKKLVTIVRKLLDSS